MNRAYYNHVAEVAGEDFAEALRQSHLSALTDMERALYLKDQEEMEVAYRYIDKYLNS